VNFLYYPRHNDEAQTYDKQKTSDAKSGSWLLHGTGCRQIANENNK
jgi:hypothetical protein